METVFAIPQPLATAVAGAAVRILGPCTVYVFGCRNCDETAGILFPARVVTIPVTHVDLLVFCGGPQPVKAALLSDAVFAATGGTITATVLLRNPKSLAAVPVSHRWFFWAVMRVGHRVCFDRAAVPFYPFDDIPVWDTDMARTAWLKCEAVAGAYYAAAAECLHEDIGLVRIAFLHESARQVALGLVAAFLGCRAGELPLRQLLALCGHFSGLAGKCFPDGDEAAIRRRKMLCAPPAMLRHWNRLDARDEDVTTLLAAIHEFIVGARQIVNQKVAQT